MIDPADIVFVSGHYPRDTFYATQTRKLFEAYTKMHGYNYYYDEDAEVSETDTHVLHFRRCSIICKASLQYPNAVWFVWVDSDVYVNNFSMKVEDQLDLTDTRILYHLFHENNWGCYPINTGVKFVHRDAIKYEAEMWELRNTDPWNTFPFEQKTVYEYVLPKIPDQYIIHDPYILNCITQAYPDRVPGSLFAHMCAYPKEERNAIIRNVPMPSV